MGQLTCMSAMLGAAIVAVSGSIGVLALPVMGLAALGNGLRFGEGARGEVGFLCEQAGQLEARVAMFCSQRAAAREGSLMWLVGHRELGGGVAWLQRAGAEALVRVSV